jgi:hypothetical protein
MTTEKIYKFLGQLKECANITRSAEYAGIDRATLYQYRKDHPEFALAWEEAWTIGYDVLEQKASDRAFDGYEEPVFWQGVEVARVKKFSDSLAQFLLRGNKSDKFKERVQSENTTTTIPAAPPKFDLSKLDKDELRQFLELAKKAEKSDDKSEEGKT